MRPSVWMRIAWPGFLVAGLLELLVFAFVDPQELLWANQHLPLSREAIYTVAFFAFWLLATLSSALTAMLSSSADEINAKGPRNTPAD